MRTENPTQHSALSTQHLYSWLVRIGIIIGEWPPHIRPKAQPSRDQPDKDDNHDQYIENLARHEGHDVPPLWSRIFAGAKHLSPS
jgi:hypothetical protein